MHASSHHKSQVHAVHLSLAHQPPPLLPCAHRISVISTANAERPSSGESDEKLRSMKASADRQVVGSALPSGALVRMRIGWKATATAGRWPPLALVLPPLAPLDGLQPHCHVKQLPAHNCERTQPQGPQERTKVGHARRAGGGVQPAGAQQRHRAHRAQYGGLASHVWPRQQRHALRGFGQEQASRGCDERAATLVGDGAEQAAWLEAGLDRTAGTSGMESHPNAFPSTHI